MYTKNNGTVLYFQVHDDFRRSGFGTYLLYLMGMTIVHRSGKDHAAIYLMVYAVLNSVSMSFTPSLDLRNVLILIKKARVFQNRC